MSKSGTALSILVLLLIGALAIVGIHTNLNGWYWQASVCFGECPGQQLASSPEMQKATNEQKSAHVSQTGKAVTTGKSPAPQDKPAAPPVSGIELPRSANQ